MDLGLAVKQNECSETDWWPVGVKLDFMERLASFSHMFTPSFGSRFETDDLQAVKDRARQRRHGTDSWEYFLAANVSKEHVVDRRN